MPGLELGLLMWFIAWAGIYLAVKLGVRDTVQERDKERLSAQTS